MLQAASQLFFHCKASIREFWFLMGKKKCKNTPIWWLGAFFFLFYKSYKKLVQDSIWNIWKTQWYNWKPWVVFAINPILRVLALGNVILSHFTISKSYSINYTIPFYNTPNIPKFYFTILHIKIIYLNNKIFFSNFFLHLPSTSITAPPLPSHHHRASTIPTMPPLPITHQNPTGTKTHIKKKKPLDQPQSKPRSSHHWWC